MTPKFFMPAGYQTRTVEFVLSRDRRGWKFYGRHVGYLIPARYPQTREVFETFSTREEAAIFAETWQLPPYAVWNGRKRRYDGKGAEFIAKARDAQ